MLPTGHQRISTSDLQQVFNVLCGIDGQPRGVNDIDAWLIAIGGGRWTRTQVAAAVYAIAPDFTGFKILPGHIGDVIRDQRRQIRDRWNCPDPPRELREDPRAELAWRRRAAIDHRDRALTALAGGGSLGDVPLMLRPEPPNEAVPAPGRVRAICEQIGERRSIDRVDDP